MRIPAELLDCVVFLCVEDGRGGWKYGGTGYFVSVNAELSDDLAFLYFVTAKHCLDQAGSRLALRLNLKAGGSAIIQLQGVWHFSTGTSDVAVIPLDMDLDQFEYRYIGSEHSATREAAKQFGIGPGDELVVVGLFTRHHGQARNRPIVRVGTVAAMPDEPIATTESHVRAYIAEMRSIGGLSGSPVFLRLYPTHANQSDGQSDRRSYFLLGQVRGHWDSRGTFGQELNQEINMGMALITPVDDLLSVLYSESLVTKRRDAVEGLRQST
jgi:hypothetical protein